MALQFKTVFSEYVDFSKIQILDATGIGSTGWATPNPVVGDVLTCQAVITKPDPTTLLPSADPTMQITKDVYFGSAGGVLPNIDGTLQDILAGDDLGYDDGKLLSGIYNIAVSGTGDDGTEIFTFSSSGYFISTGKVDCCITKMRLKADIKECGDCYDKSIASNARRGRAYITGALLAFKNGLYDQAALFLIRANEICDQCVPCKC